ncbi:MAG: hypothetical protein GY870_09155, partial [archaeon]|nr:hypothetical protein [archaeon]
MYPFFLFKIILLQKKKYCWNSYRFQIKKNAKAAKKALMKEKIPIVAEDLFGTQGRTI